MTQKISLASDNWSPVHPYIFQYVASINNGYAAPYGNDPWTQRAKELIQNSLKKRAKIIMVPNGTGSNVLSLKIACHSYESVICTNIAHIHFQESGSAEALVGCKLLTVPHENGKITPNEILKKIHSERAFKFHATQPRVLSITQPTEIGTVYQLDELKEIAAICKQENLLLHMDGSRLYNAAISLNTGLDTIIEASQVDILSLGGTKNGLMGAETLIIFNQELQKGSDYLHKQMLQLLSKMRYLSAQFIPFFENNLWAELAYNANQKAQKIEAIIKKYSSLSLVYPVETNQIFFRGPKEWIEQIQEKVHCYLWNHENNELRLVTSWDTSDEDIENFDTTLASILIN